MIRCFTIAALMLSLLVAVLAQPRAEQGIDLMSDTWVATDALGRSLPLHDAVGAPQTEKTVGIFYFTWHGEHSLSGPWNITRILDAHPEALDDTNHPAWGPFGDYHHWGESIFGYYLSDDRHVIRKHAQMLSDAGVDALFFDATNGFTYKNSYMTLLDEFRRIRAAGGRTPQIAFIAPFSNYTNTVNVVNALYNDLYDGEPELWSGEGDINYAQTLGDELYVEVNGDTPLLYSLDHLGLDASQYDTLELRIRAMGGGGRARLAWVTRNSGLNWNTSRYVEFDLDGAGVWQEIEIDLGASPFWNDTIRQLRLEPIRQGLHQEVRIDWLAVTGGSDPDRYRWDFGSVDYEELFFQWEGKPVIMGNRFYIGSSAIRDRFTWRQPIADYQSGPSGPEQWGWLEIYPQHSFYDSFYQTEQVCVGVAQNAVALPGGGFRAPTGFQEDNTLGRSYWHGTPPAGDPLLEGFNFRQQWERALALDPPFIFLTGWNEWTAIRFNEFGGVLAPVVFVDQFTTEKSRDIEPTRASIGDNYYYQMVANIRRFKGARVLPGSDQTHDIVIDGDFSDWTGVTPEFLDTPGDAVQRDHMAWEQGAEYVNDSGLNDLLAARMATDGSSLYAYLRCAEPIQLPAGQGRCVLFLDTDSDPGTGWLGYDVAIGQAHFNGSLATFSRHGGGGWNWNYQQTIDCRLQGGELELAIPAGLLPELDLDAPFRFDFKWGDGALVDDQVEKLTTHGDAAPNDRFNYRFLHTPPTAARDWQALD